MELTEEEIRLLRLVERLYAVKYSQMAALLYSGDLKKTYAAVNGVINKGLLRQKEDPFNRRQRALLLTAQGARELQTSDWHARVYRSKFFEVLENNEFYVKAVAAGVHEKDILTRHEALQATGADKRYARMSWGIRSKRGVHYVYVRHNWVPKQQVANSVIYCGNKAASHTAVCRSDKGLWFNVRWFMRHTADIPLNIITLEEVPSYVFWLTAQFSDTAWKVMEALTPGGRLAYADSDCPVSLAWHHPSKGTMLLADLRVGDLHTLRGLKGYSFSAEPVTAFVTSEKQARRWAYWLRWPEKLWFVAYSGGPGCTLYRVSGNDIAAYKTVNLEEAAAR